MLTFLAENAATIIISLVLILVVTLIILKWIRDRKNGRSSCGCGCAGCPSADVCHRK